MESFRTAEGRGRARRPVARLVALGVAAAMAVCLLPGTVAAAAPTQYLTVTPGTATVVQGTVVYLQATAYLVSDSTVSVVAATETPLDTFSVTGTAAGTCDSTNPGPPDPNFVTGYADCVFTTTGTATVYATNTADSTDYIPGSAVITVTSSGVAGFTVEMSGYYAIPQLTEPFDETVGVADTAKVCAVDSSDAVLTGYTGTIRFSSTDPLAALPANYTFVAADAGCHTFSVTFGTTDEQLLIVNDTSNIAMYGVVEVGVFLPEAYDYTALDSPVRVLDTRIGLGLSGPLSANVGVSFPVASTSGIPWCATAVTGNLTVVNQTSGWAVYLGPNQTNTPTTSAINFNAGSVVGNSLTVAVNPTTGYVGATYISTTGNTTDLVFDVTGYYGDTGPCSDGDYYHSLFTPVRALDTRNNTGFAGKLTAGLPATFHVAGGPGSAVPGSADAVTGNLTVVNSTCGWAAYVGPLPMAIPATSTVNFTAGQIVGNGVTVAVGPFGNLSATYISEPGCTTDLVFDITGYYNDSSEGFGMDYVPMAPVRVLDTRTSNGAVGPAYANLPMPFRVSMRDWIPWEAGAVTGNITVVNETNGWAVYVGGASIAAPTTSNINFLKGDVRGNGTTVGLSIFPPLAGEFGDLNATYISTGGNTTDLVFDVTGYFVPDLLTGP